MNNSLEYLSNSSLQFWSSYKKTYKQSFKDVSSQEVLSRIEKLVQKFVKDLREGERPGLEILKSRENAGYDAECSIHALEGNSVSMLKVGSLKSNKKYARIWKVLRVCYELLKHGTKCNKRELYYLDPMLFESQTHSDKALEAVSQLLKVPRNRLNIIASPKGIISGSITYIEDDMETTVGNRILQIPSDPDYITTSASFILVIEKEAVLHRLINEEFLSRYECILISGKGYPDLSTREFLHRLVNEFSHIPVLVLTDCDPHGFRILCTYTFGAMARPGECEYLAVPFAHWLGLHFEDAKNSALPLTKTDQNILERLLSMPQFSQAPNNYQNQRFALWKQSMQMLIEHRVKFEIESISSIAGKGISEYVSYKIDNGLWLYSFFALFVSILRFLLAEIPKRRGMIPTAIIPEIE